MFRRVWPYASSTLVTFEFCYFCFQKAKSEADDFVTDSSESSGEEADGEGGGEGDGKPKIKKEKKKKR